MLINGACYGELIHINMTCSAGVEDVWQCQMTGMETVIRGDE